MSIQLNPKSKPLYFLLILLGLYCLLPFLLLSFYAYPQADDYPFGLRDRQTDFWSTQVMYYLNWSGRFFGTAILRLNPLTTKSFGTYPYYALGVILALVTSLTFLLFKVLRPQLTRLEVFGLAALCIGLYLVHLPSTAEGLFWLTGFLTYTVPNVLFLLLLYFLYSMAQAPERSMKLFYTAAAALTGTLIAGANEMALLYLMATLLYIAIITWRSHSPFRFYYVVVFILCLLVSMAVVLAPGNFSRMGSHPQSGQPIWSVTYAGALTVATFYRWGGLLLLSSLVYVFLFGEKIRVAFGKTAMLQAPLPLLLLYLTGTVFLMNFLFVWATGERPTPRLQNVIYFFLLLAWFYALQVFVNQRPQWFKVEAWPAFVRASVVILLLLTFLHLDNNISTAYLDLLSGKAAKYKAELSVRDRRMSSSSCQHCVVEPLSVIPASLYFLNLQPEENQEAQWVNNDYALYWGKASVRLSGPTPPVQDNYSTLVEVGKKWRDQIFH